MFPAPYLRLKIVSKNKSDAKKSGAASSRLAPPSCGKVLEN